MEDTQDKITREVVTFGNGGHIIVPKHWVGQEVEITIVRKNIR